MSDDRFALLSRVIEAPSPVNLEGAMTRGVLEPHFRDLMRREKLEWAVDTFVGSAAIVVDTMPHHAARASRHHVPGDADDALTVMVVGHADKIRMQVRHVDKGSGKVYVDSDSFIPIALLGHDVSVYAEDPERLGSFIRVRGSVEALGAIHFADAATRAGTKGVTSEQLYVDFGVAGADAAKRIAALGVKPGDAVLMDRPVRRTLGDDGFSGAYLDNGIGSFVTADLARVLATTPRYRAALESVRVLFAVAAHEEIGRLGSRVLAAHYRPDVLIAVDVNHDYANAPNVASKRFPPLCMGAGFTLSVGAVASRKVNELVQRASKRRDIPLQLDNVGRDTGTDAMAAVLASVDCAVASLGVPTRNMHTATETASTRDVDACLFALAETIALMAEERVARGDLKRSHVDLSLAREVRLLPPAPAGKGGAAKEEGGEKVEG